MIKTSSFLKSFFSCLLFSCLLLSPSAHARIFIQIDQASDKKFPIAVADLIPQGKSSAIGEDIPDIIRKNLGLTGMFELIPASQHPTDGPGISPNLSAIQFAPWTLIGAQALVIGTYSGGKSGVQVEMGLFDPVTATRLASKSYTTSVDELSIVANHFSDEIMRELTGERGVFSTEIAYIQAAKKGKEIGLMDMNGENAGTITKDKSINLSPAFSPDGKSIAYTSFSKTGNAEIYVTGSHGGGSKKITSSGTVNVSPTWSPNGLLTVAQAQEGDTNLVLLNLAGNLVRKLTSSFGIDVNPSWSPDGSQLVFASERAGRLHLFKSDASGNHVERLTYVGVQNDNPAWSPKGDKIVFQSLEGNWDLFIMNTDGSMLQRLTSGQGNNESPTWAPNARFIAFTSTRSGKTAVHLMREDGSNPTEVGPAGSLQPSWGPWVK